MKIEIRLKKYSGEFYEVQIIDKERSYGCIKTDWSHQGSPGHSVFTVAVLGCDPQGPGGPSRL